MLDTANQYRDGYEQSDVHVKDLINDSIEAANESFDRHMEEDGVLLGLKGWRSDKNEMRKSKSTLREDRDPHPKYAWNANTEGSEDCMHNQLDLHGDLSERQQHSIDYTPMERFSVKKSSYHEDSPQKGLGKKIRLIKRLGTNGKA